MKINSLRIFGNVGSKKKYKSNSYVNTENGFKIFKK